MRLRLLFLFCTCRFESRNLRTMFMCTLPSVVMPSVMGELACASCRPMFYCAELLGEYKCLVLTPAERDSSTS